MKKEPVGAYVVAYCDGSCNMRDQMGGWGYVVHDGLDLYEKFGHAFNTTNNQMELVAAIEAMECMLELKMHRRPVIICTDSQYVANGSLSEERWRARGVRDKVKNLDLWKNVWACMSHFDHCSFAWVRGHKGHYWNCYVDKLARKGRERALVLESRSAEKTKSGARGSCSFY